MSFANLAKIPVRNIFKVNQCVLSRCKSSTESKSSSTVTHTGQDWEADDYRNCRFMVAPKQTNKNWAVKLVNEVPSKLEKERVIFCDGGGGPLGHPKVYINLDQKGEHTCGYCGQRFHKDHHH
ncbi:NADH dehydrogenase [ubiquinone] iron-sulfur protein 6, mitochondrial [Ctenocephalides felis]|uniref:NADH dehydrogenase [ubiquinone] iron-sulfur protein 6, mitochondrial n=1 Tax=Ctenocephalides felis TaxID=7515 RepID=UPI000E6E511E|nr:NADH dehydrogenase [ubiquinone] iron-sulfur protein 6, mitochondrial [Ctenocephalides felis]